MLKKYLELFFIFLSLALQAQSYLLPFYQNFSKNDYSGENQNWSVAQDNFGNMFFANNHNILKYNGAFWQKLKYPKQTVIRSVFADGDRLYCGSYKEFGYWKADENLEYKYHSLTENKNLFSKQSSEEIWKIFKFGNKIYFQSFNTIYILDSGKIKIIPLPETITFAYVVGNEILISGVSGAIYQLKNDKITLKYRFPELSNKIIHSIKNVNNQLWIFTLKYGVFVLKDKTLVTLSSPLNKILKESLINNVLQISSNQLLIGTVNNGLIEYDLATQFYKIINHSLGLMNNSVLAIFQDKEKNIWLGLDNGIAYLEFNSPYKIMTDLSGKLGSVYSLKYHDKEFLLASNHGLYRFNDNELQKIPNAEGQMWDIFPFENQFICGGNDGTYIYKNQQSTKLNNNSGTDFQALGIPNYYVQSSYIGVFLYEYKNGNWTWKKINYPNRPIKKISTIHKNIIFALDFQKGIYAIKYDNDLKSFSTTNITEKSNLKEDYHCSLVELNANVYFLVDKIFYQYNPITEKLEKNQLLNNQFKNTLEVYNISDKEWFLINDIGAFLVKYKDGKFLSIPIQEKYYRGKLIPNFVDFDKSSDTVFITLDDGFFLINPHHISDKKAKLQYQIKIEDSVFNVKKNIPFQHKQLFLNVLSGYYGDNAPVLYYSLDNDLAPILIKNNQINLSHLNSGRYEIKIYQNIQNKIQQIDKVDIKIASPWYFSWWMILFYILFLFFGIYIYFNVQHIKTKQKIKLIEEENKHLHEMEMLEKKKELEKAQISLEKHKIETDYNLKSSELASKALLLAKYNRLEDDINSLVSKSEDEDLKKKLKRMINQNRSKKEWEVFEANINIVHNDFIKRLIKAHPNLTPKDIQLSVFLRMNLSSKEIAPLFSITYRGVEIHRYRLRKKMNLDSQVNLSKYMISF